MSNLDVLHEVFEKAGPLREVWVSRFNGDANFVTEVKLSFEGLALVVAASGSDTVAVRIGEFVSEPNIVLHNAGSEVAWSAALGLSLRWLWELTNQQGYSDGVRFEFANPDTGIRVEFELIVTASMLHVYQCSTAPWSAA